jgi:hypothetical protein
LEPGGLWLSLIGSTEGPPREIGPPRVRHAKSPSRSSLRWRSWSCDQLSSAVATQRRGSVCRGGERCWRRLPRGRLRLEGKTVPFSTSAKSPMRSPRLTIR